MSNLIVKLYTAHTWPDIDCENRGTKVVFLLPFSPGHATLHSLHGLDIIIKEMISHVLVSPGRETLRSPRRAQHTACW